MISRTKWPRPAVLAVASSCAFLLTACSGDAGTGHSATDEAATSFTSDSRPESEPQEGPETGDVIAQQLNEGLTSDPASVMSPEAEFTDDQAREGLPPGSEVEVHADSWSSVGVGQSGVVVITVTQPSGLAGSFAAVVQLEGESWKIVSTFPLEDQ